MTEQIPTPPQNDELDQAVDLANNNVKVDVDPVDEALALGNAKPRVSEVDPWEHAPSAAHRVFEANPAPQSTEEEPRTKEQPLSAKALAKGAGIALGATAALGGAMHLADNATSAPEFSDKTTTITVEQGDSEWKIANEIEGIELVNDKQDVVAHIQNDPANATAYENGQLDPGDQLTIPTEVKN